MLLGVCQRGEEEYISDSELDEQQCNQSPHAHLVSELEVDPKSH